MSVAVHRNAPRFLFFWNNKVASRSLLAGLEATFPDVATYPQSAFRPDLDDGSWPRFLMVRSPWARAVSAYRNKCRDAARSVARHGALEPCQRHLLAALGFRPPTPQAGADRLAALSFPDFVGLLSTVRDGNSHFRLQVDVLRHAGAVRNRAAWLVRAAQAVTLVARTHYRTPGALRPSLDGAHVAEAVAAARDLSVHVIRLEELPDAWHVVEEVLGQSFSLPWHTRTATEDDWRDFYDADTRDRIGRLYEADAEAFGYEAP